MGIIKRGESGKSSIKNYYNQLKTDNWKGNTRDIRAPFLGPTGRRKHLHGAAVLGGLYLLGQQSLDYLQQGNMLLRQLLELQ